MWIGHFADSTENCNQLSSDKTIIEHFKWFGCCCSKIEQYWWEKKQQFQTNKSVSSVLFFVCGSCVLINIWIDVNRSTFESHFPLRRCPSKLCAFKLTIAYGIYIFDERLWFKSCWFDHDGRWISRYVTRISPFISSGCGFMIIELKLKNAYASHIHRLNEWKNERMNESFCVLFCFVSFRFLRKKNKL